MSKYFLSKCNKIICRRFLELSKDITLEARGVINADVTLWLHVVFLLTQQDYVDSCSPLPSKFTDVNFEGKGDLSRTRHT